MIAGSTILGTAMQVVGLVSAEATDDVCCVRRLMCLCSRAKANFGVKSFSMVAVRMILLSTVGLWGST